MNKIHLEETYANKTVSPTVGNVKSTHSPSQSGQVFSLRNMDTHSPLHLAQSQQRILTSKEVKL